MQDATTQLQGPKNRALKFFSITAILLALSLLPINQTWAKPYRVLIVSSGNSTVYKDVIDTIQTLTTSSPSLSKTHTNVKFDVLFLKSTSTIGQLQRRVNNKSFLLTIGKKAIILASSLKKSPPIIATLIPKQTYDEHLPALRIINKKTTAIFIENPLDRQILLAKTLLGDAQRLGVLIGDKSLLKKNKIKIAIQTRGVKANIERVKSKDSLIRKLSNVLNDSDVFLALPDPQIFNRKTAKNILLTTYRHRIPIIAYSASYVKAGALAAVYSTPQQLAEQTANTLIKVLLPNTPYPKQNFYPENFEVSINKNVARSLNLPITSESKIKNAMITILGREK